MRYARILSTGRYVPARVVTNHDLEQRLGEPLHDWLVANVGIRERHVMADDEVTSDLAVAAARQALERAGVAADTLDLVRARLARYKVPKRVTFLPALPSSPAGKILKTELRTRALEEARP